MYVLWLKKDNKSETLKTAFVVDSRIPTIHGNSPKRVVVSAVILVAKAPSRTLWDS
jgi:hypothetical protein